MTLEATILPSGPVASGQAWVLCAMGALTMSYGWGFRGDYGHESGAMIPGALLAMGVCICSGRTEWVRRCAVFGLCGAVGWAFGGQQSYGQVTSYTVSHSLPDVVYGYACLFVVGMLWGGIGGAILSFALTRSRAELERFVAPLLTLFGAWLAAWLILRSAPEWAERYDTVSVEHLHDTDWLAATIALVVLVPYWWVASNARRACTVPVVMAAGWWIGYVLLVRAFDLHMSPKPPGTGIRSDNWGGCVGMLVALLAYLVLQRNRAGFMLAMYGALAGGIAFTVGDFINKPDKVRWAPWYQHEWVRGFDHWKWSEQTFGLIMGLGVSLGLLRLLRGNLAMPREGERVSRIDYLGAFTVVVVIMWMTVRKNVPRWIVPTDRNEPMDQLFGLDLWIWVFAMGILLSVLVVYALTRYHRGRLPLAPATAIGKAQVLFLLTMWISLLGVFMRSLPNFRNHGILFVHGSFWLTCIACTGLLLRQDGAPITWSTQPEASCRDARWHLGWRHWSLWATMPLLVLALSGITLAMHDEPMPGSRARFGPEAFHLTGKTLEP